MPHSCSHSSGSCCCYKSSCSSCHYYMSAQYSPDQHCHSSTQQHDAPIVPMAPLLRKALLELISAPTNVSELSLEPMILKFTFQKAHLSLSEVSNVKSAGFGMEVNVPVTVSLGSDIKLSGACLLLKVPNPSLIFWSGWQRLWESNR